MLRPQKDAPSPVQADRIGQNKPSWTSTTGPVCALANTFCYSSALQAVLRGNANMRDAEPARRLAIVVAHITDTTLATFDTK